MGFLLAVGLKGHINPSESLTSLHPAGVMAIQDGHIQRGRKIQLICVHLHDTQTCRKMEVM